MGAYLLWIDLIPKHFSRPDVAHSGIDSVEVEW